MRFEDLELFVTVIQEGNFSSAARRLHLSQPAVSGRIAHLEKELGTALLIREARGAAPTSSGKVLYHEALRMLQGLEEIKQRIQEESEHPVGPLILTAGDASGVYLGPLLLGGYKQRYPRVQPQLILQSIQESLDSISQQQCNLGIVPLIPDDPRLEAIPLFEDDMCLIVPIDHPLAEKSRVEAQELKGYPFLVRRQGRRIHSMLEQAFARLGMKFSDLTISMELYNNEAVKNGVIAGMGIGLANRMSLRNDRGGYRVLEVDGLDTRRVYRLIRRVEDDRSYAERMFWEYCTSEEAMQLLARLRQAVPTSEEAR